MATPSACHTASSLPSLLRGGQALGPQPCRATQWPVPQPLLGFLKARPWPPMPAAAHRCFRRLICQRGFEGGGTLISLPGACHTVGAL